MGRFFERLQNYIATKNEKNENKIILGDFNCTGGNKIQRIFRCCSNYILIVDNGLRTYEEPQTPLIDYFY